jgi:hypothetical protein
MSDSPPPSDGGAPQQVPADVKGAEEEEAFLPAGLKPIVGVKKEKEKQKSVTFEKDEVQQLFDDSKVALGREKEKPKGVGGPLDKKDVGFKSETTEMFLEACAEFEDGLTPNQLYLTYSYFNFSDDWKYITFDSLVDIFDDIDVGMYVCICVCVEREIYICIHTITHSLTHKPRIQRTKARSRDLRSRSS